MDYRHGKMRMSIESDRLSSLPDDLIHKILFFVDIKEAIRTSVLSSRWRFILTSMPYLEFSIDRFYKLSDFSKFVTNVLSRRNNLTEVHSLKLCYHVNARHVVLNKILNYALSHNLQQLDMVCLLDKYIEFPLSLFSSQSLKHLSLTMQSHMHHTHSCLTSTWELPTLTTLDLRSVTLRESNADEGSSTLFSKCANLKNLSLKQFETTGSNSLSIFHPRLSNLILDDCGSLGTVINVAAPQLKNLTIKFCSAKQVKISAPDLLSLIFIDFRPLHITTEGFHSLEKADICVSRPQNADAHLILGMLEQLHNVKFLTLSLEIVEVLSSAIELILPQPSPFVNLKSLKIYPDIVHLWEHEPKRVTIMPANLRSYLLDSSSQSTFTKFLREEILEEKLLAELRVLLEKEKDNTETNRARLEQRKAPVQSHTQEIGRNMALIKDTWENLGVELQKRKEKACFIISKLQRFEELLASLPTSNRAKYQPCFSSLRAEADIVLHQITNSMKAQCDENQIRSSVFFCEPATTLESSS